MGRKRKTTEADERRAETGRRIDLARAQIGVSKSELAGACGVSPPTVTGWIQGKHAPSPENLIEICRVVRKPASFFEVGGFAELDATAVFEREFVRLAGARTAARLLELSPREFRTELEAGSDASGSELDARLAKTVERLTELLTVDELEGILELVFTAVEIGMLDELVLSQLESARSFAERLNVKTTPIRDAARDLANFRS